MGAGFSHLIPCLKPSANKNDDNDDDAAIGGNDNHQSFGGGGDDLVFEPLDEALGHSFCYVRSSSRFLSPTGGSDRFLSPSSSLRFDDKPTAAAPATTTTTTSFRSISGASVSANTSTPRTFLDDDEFGGAAAAAGAVGRGIGGSVVSGFESTASFNALPLQPVPRGEVSGPIERSGFFLSGPIERGALSGPLDLGENGDGAGAEVAFSAPIGGGGGGYVRRKRKKGFAGIRKALYRSLSEKKRPRPWVVPVRSFVGKREGRVGEVVRGKEESNVQWALGKAGEDRVHVVVSEEHGWLFVGIYDGFNGPDAPEFLMGHLYRAVYNELKGLFWDCGDSNHSNHRGSDSNPGPVQGEGDWSVGLACETSEVVVEKAVESSSMSREVVDDGEIQVDESQPLDTSSVKRVTFQSDHKVVRRKLWEYLAEGDGEEEGLDLSGSDRFAFSVDDAVRVSNAGSSVSRQSLLLSRLKQGLSWNKDGHGKKLLLWRFGVQEKEKNESTEVVAEENAPRSRRRTGPVDHNLVLSALSQALEKTELAYLDLTDKVIDRFPELALMGSCLLVVLMRNEDVYVMNVGDSRAIVAQLEVQEPSCNVKLKDKEEEGSSMEGILEETAVTSSRMNEDEGDDQVMKLTALQLSKDHSTSIQEEVLRIKNEHPDDSQCIVNGRVKGRLQVTRAFGAGFLKQAKWNDSLLEMFRNEFIGTAPYITCTPSLCHHKLGSRDQFLVLSSDGLYQYLTNQEVVSHVANFIEKFPDGDPAQHLIEELLSRAAKKAGMDFHDLLDIPQGDRRKYHDDVTVMVVSLEGRIWKSSGKYP
ncbi:hypothetical protein Droror1_Dr00025439 [Drosera rotundifolia]